MQSGLIRRRTARLPVCILSLSFSLAFYASIADAETTVGMPTIRTVRLGSALADIPEPDEKLSVADILRGATRVESYIDLFQKDEQLYAILEADDFEQDLLVLISIARGIGQRPLFAGATWDFGNDWVCQFRRVGERVHFVRRNTRYRSSPGTPEAQAIRDSFSDSILASLPILAERESGAVLVDLSSLLMSDLSNVQETLPGFEFSPQRSNLEDVEGFPNNFEIGVSATYTSDGSTKYESVPDSRALTVGLHYSISRLPESNYQPRVADDRIGYFLTVSKDYSSEPQEDRFVRYINRWYLEKADASLSMSAPKEPIVFWIEKTVPHRYREAIRAGMLEWNRAFEKLGFKDAIVVKQQPDDATWNPCDVRYNTFRWITSGISIAMGPTRVNPLTGQILDADIVFDADYLQRWKRKYEYFSPEDVSLMTGGAHDLNSYRNQRSGRHSAGLHRYSCLCQHGFSHEIALSSSVLATASRSSSEVERLTQQGIKKTVMHEVGHALGLRHNFKGSTYLSMGTIRERSLDAEPRAMAGSVMDYLPAKFARGDQEQGRFYTPTIGPYDHWAIEYGYRQFDMADTMSEQPYLQAIAMRSAEQGHAFATDEETRGIDADPGSGVYDFGNDPLEFAEHQAQLVAESWDGLVERVTGEGKGYQRSRQAFGVLLATHGRAMYTVAKLIGGIHTTHSHRGDPNSTAPYRVVTAEHQRRTLQFLSQYLFSDEYFQAPLQLGTKLSTSHWNHWGSEIGERTDFPAHQSILMWQRRIVDKLLSPLTLARLHDSEILIPSDEDAFTVAELMERMTDEIFSELWTVGEGEYSNRKPAISSLRRNLQSEVLERYVSLTQMDAEAPAICSSLAVAELNRIAQRSRKLLTCSIRFDSYTRAHLAELVRQAEKTLDR